MNQLWVVVGPSATGKSTLLGRLVSELGMLETTSLTTRSPRPTDRPGEYEYVSEKEFVKRVNKGEFVEHVHYVGSGKRYGTTKKELSTKLAAGDVVIIAEGHGAEQFQKAVPGTKVIFLLPPATPELKRRMINRATNNGELQVDHTVMADIDKRLASIEEECTWARLADVVIAPTTPEDTFRIVKGLVERQRAEQEAVK